MKLFEKLKRMINNTSTQDLENKFLNKHPEFDNIHDNERISVMVGVKGNIPSFKNYLCDIMTKKNFMEGVLRNYKPENDNYELSILKYHVYMDIDKHVKYTTDLSNAVNITHRYFPETDEWYDVTDGMTQLERDVSSACIDIVSLMSIAPAHHVNHNADIADAIHVIQRILQSRTCHRLYPDKYPIKNGKEK